MTDDKRGIDIHAFTDLDEEGNLAPYVSALEIFDALPQLQELKALARTQIRSGDTVLDVGCGFGLESLKLARLVEPGGKVIGIDKSAAFIKEAQGRAAKAKASIDFQVGDADTLPFQDGTFDVSRAERVLVYLPDPKQALREMHRVTCGGGTISAIEPDFGATAINFPDEELTRRILDHECDKNVPHGWLVRDMPWLLEDVGFTDVRIDTRIVILPSDLGASVFTQMGVSAEKAGVISAAELELWAAGIKDLRHRDRLFCGVGYYRFAAKA